MMNRFGRGQPERNLDGLVTHHPNAIMTGSIVSELDAECSRVLGAYNPSVVDDGAGGLHLLFRWTADRNLKDYPRRFIGSSWLNPILIALKKVDWGTSLSRRIPRVKGLIPESLRFNSLASISYAHLTRSGLALDKLSTFVDPNDPQFPEWFRFHNGFQDPRVTKLGDKYYVLCAGCDDRLRRTRVPGTSWIEGATIVLFVTRDFEHLDHYGVIGPDIYDKNAVLHPKLVTVAGQRRLMLYHRVFPSIRYVLVDDLEDLSSNSKHRKEFWERALSHSVLEQQTILRPRDDERSVGLSSVPIETEVGWLAVYHALHKCGRYCAGVALLDADRPWELASRPPGYFLSPAGSHRVVFPTGAVVRPTGLDGTPKLHLWLYYGSDDREIRLAVCPLSQLLDYLVSFDANGRRRRRRSCRR